MRSQCLGFLSEQANQPSGTRILFTQTMPLNHFGNTWPGHGEWMQDNIVKRFKNHRVPPVHYRDAIGSDNRPWQGGKAWHEDGNLAFNACGLKMKIRDRRTTFVAEYGDCLACIQELRLGNSSRKLSAFTSATASAPTRAAARRA